ncbi:MAG: polysaccharide biosynthesis/export family protein, partial [Planctomycetota bacterium]
MTTHGRTILALAGLALATACTHPPTNPDTVSALVKENYVSLETRTDLKVESVETELPPQVDEYRLGVNDVLHITVVGHPEFTGAGTRGEGQLVGTRIQKDGKIHPPMLPGIQAAGRSVPELRADLTKALSEFIVKPQVGVEVLRFESQRFYVLGEVDEPGVFPVDGSTTLLEGIARAGGVLETGNLEWGYVIRGRKLLPINLADLLLRGDTSRNVFMKHGDLVYIPDKEDWKVYVLGEVMQAGIVVMNRRGLTLAEALTAVGGINPLFAKRSQIRLFRGGWQRPKSYRLSTEDVYAFGTSIRLHP